MRGLAGVALAALAAACARGPASLRIPGDARVLVVAPHPDDETLAVGGLIHRLARARVPVRVVFLTNGDGYPEAVSGTLRAPRPEAADYVALGALRQREAVAALRHLGVAGRHVRFLGFPDRGLAALWQGYWARPYESPYTRATRPPYRDTLDPRVDYEGRDLAGVLARLLGEFRPTLVVMPHPADTHADHAAASRFVVEGVERAQAAGWLPPDVRQLAYLVHYPSWPRLAGPSANRRLVPLAEVSDTAWTETELTPEEVGAKRAALAEYRSQLGVMRGFLRSFAGDNELLGVVDPQALARIAAQH
jgi:LmbE family N-acetylglucosaminyl deacetylase